MGNWCAQSINNPISRIGVDGSKLLCPGKKKSELAPNTTWWACNISNKIERTHLNPPHLPIDAWSRCHLWNWRSANSGGSELSAQSVQIPVLPCLVLLGFIKGNLKITKSLPRKHQNHQGYSLLKSPRKAQNLGGPNGFLPLAHHNRAITESLGKLEIHGPQHFCDLCRRNVQRHENSDHLMPFKERVLTRSISMICAGDVPARKSFLSLHFLDFLIFLGGHFGPEKKYFALPPVPEEKHSPGALPSPAPPLRITPHLPLFLLKPAPPATPSDASSLSPAQEHEIYKKYSKRTPSFDFWSGCKEQKRTKTKEGQDYLLSATILAEIITK